MPKHEAKREVRPVHGGADGEARADVEVSCVSVAYDAEFERPRLVLAVFLHEAPHSFLADIWYVRAHAVKTRTNVPRQHTKDRGGRPGPTFARIIMGECPASKEQGRGVKRVLAEGRGHNEVLDGVRLFHGGHPSVPIEVAGCGEAGDVRI